MWWKEAAPAASRPQQCLDAWVVWSEGEGFSPLGWEAKIPIGHDPC